jgi:DNA polymerase III subunit beta
LASGASGDPLEKVEFGADTPSRRKSAVKIVADQAKLSQKLQSVGAVVPTKTTLTILSNVLLQAESDHVRLTATDLDLAMTTTLPAQVEQPGKVCVQARRLSEIVRSLPPAEVKFSAKAEAIRIQCGKSDFKIKGADPEEYPKVADRMKEKGFAIPVETLNRMIDRVLHAVSQDLSRVALTGVLWEFDKASFSMVATDGSRLSKTTRPDKVAVGSINEVIVPGKALQHLQRLMPAEGEVRVTVSESYIGFDLGDTFLHSRLLEGPFPNYRPVIPTGNKHKLTVEREGLTQATRRVAILSNTLTHQIKMGLRPDLVSLSVSTPDLGEAQEDVVAAYDGPPMDIGFNASFLLDILKSVDSGDVEFALDRADTAAMVHPVNGKEGEEFFCLLMPLRLAE